MIQYDQSDWKKYGNSIFATMSPHADFRNQVKENLRNEINNTTLRMLREK